MKANHGGAFEPVAWPATLVAMLRGALADRGPQRDAQVLGGARSVARRREQPRHRDGDDEHDERCDH
jgi:hypothetical protein